MFVSVHGLQMGYNYLVVGGSLPQGTWPWNGMETGITGLLVLKAAAWLFRWPWMRIPTSTLSRLRG
jgi:hypothetical protein